MDNYDIAGLALKSCFPNNEIIYDDVGEPSIMVKIPKMTLQQLGMGDSTEVHPAFIIDGKTVEEIYIGKYLSCMHNNRAYSLPDRDPQASINFDNASKACTIKGKGWHLMTRMELGLLIRIMQYNNFFPDGNILYGKGADGKYRARPSFWGDDGQIRRTATGTGLEAYSHNNSLSGIADLRGDVWEWSGGLRIFKGELQILENNNGANSTFSQSSSSQDWRCISCTDGTYITPNGEGTTPDSIKLDYRDGCLTYSNTKTYLDTANQGCYFKNIKCAPEVSEAAKLKLQNLGLLMYKEGELFGNQYTYFSLIDERFLFSGGGFNSGAYYGAASFYGYSSRFNDGWDVGFRCAFAKI